MTENQVSQKLIKILNSLPNCHARKQPGGKFQSGQPDILCVIQGWCVLIEVKLDKGRLTPLQGVQLEHWRKAGAMTWLAIWQRDDKKIYFVTPGDLQLWSTLVEKELIQKPEWQGPLDRNSIAMWIDETVNHNN